MKYQIVDDLNAPCPYCVQWRCSVPEPHDDSNCVYDGHEWEPYWPDGSVAPFIRDRSCARCDAAIAAYMEDSSL